MFAQGYYEDQDGALSTSIVPDRTDNAHQTGSTPLPDVSDLTDPEAGDYKANDTAAEQQREWTGAQALTGDSATLRFQDGTKATPLSMNHFSQQQVEDLAAAAVTVLRASRKLEPSRQTALLLRNKLDYEREASRYNRHYFEESSSSFVDRVAAANPHGLIDDTAPNLQPSMTTLHATNTPVEPAHQDVRGGNQIAALQKLILDDKLAVDEQDEKISKLQEELSHTEFSMQSREKKLADATLVLVQILQDSGFAELAQFDADVVSRAITKEPSISIRAQSPSRHPTLEDYYNKMGDVQVLRERLVELELDHRDMATLRVFRQDQGLPGEVPDDEFGATYDKERSILLQQYGDCIRAASDAREACVEEGIDPDAYKRSYSPRSDDPELPEHEDPRPSSSMLSNAQRPVTAQQRTNTMENTGLGSKELSSAMLTAITGNLGDELRRSSLKETPDIARVRQRVEEWMQDSDVEGLSSDAQDKSVPLQGTDENDVMLLEDDRPLHGEDTPTPTMAVEEPLPADPKPANASGEQPSPASETARNVETTEPRAVQVCFDYPGEARQDSPIDGPMPMPP